MKSPEFLHLLSLFLFGFNGVTAAYIHLSSDQIVILRLLIGVLFLLPFSLRFIKTFSITSRTLAATISAGFFMGISWIFLYSAYRHIGVSQASVIYYFGPVLVMAVTAFTRTEQIHSTQWICLIIALCGLFLCIGQNSSWIQDSYGILKACASALCYAGMILCARQIRTENNFMSAFLILAAALGTVAAYFTFGQNGVPTFSAVMESAIPLLVLGIVNTGFSCLLSFRAVPKLSAATVSVVGYLEPLTAVVAATLFLSEPLTALQIIGISMLFGGAAAAQRIGCRNV